MKRLVLLLFAFLLVLPTCFVEVADAAPAKKHTNYHKPQQRRSAPSKNKKKKGGAKPKPIPIVTHNIGNGLGQKTKLRPVRRKVYYKKNGKRYSKIVVEERKPLNTTFDGIDISRHQGLIVWPTVRKNTKMKYVYIKATEGGDLRDVRYHENTTHASAQGYKVGSYLYFRPNTPAEQQFQNFIEQVNVDKQDLLPMVDIEEDGKLGKAKLVANVKELLELFNEYFGQKPLLYTMRNFYDAYLADDFMEYKFMIGAYSRYPEFKNGMKPTIWQFSCQGVVDGIDADVDLSVFNTGCGINDIWLDKCLIKGHDVKNPTYHINHESELEIQKPLVLPAAPQKKKRFQRK